MQLVDGRGAPGISSLLKTGILSALLTAVAVPVHGNIPNIETPGVFEVIAGGYGNIEGSPALTFHFESHSVDLEIDSRGRLYFENHGYLRRVEADGTISAFVRGDFGGDPGISDFYIQGENLYYADGERIFRVDLNTDETRDITPANLVLDDFLHQIAVDSGGNIYFTLRSVGQVYVISAAGGAVQPFAGLEEYCWECPPFEDGDAAIGAAITPMDLLIDPADDALVFVDFETSRIARVDPESKALKVLADASEQVFADSLSFTEGIFSIDYLPDGDIVFSDGIRSVWRADPQSGEVALFAGGAWAWDPYVDGKQFWDVAIQSDQLAVDGEGNVYTSSNVRTTYGDPNPGSRVYFLNVANEMINTVMGAPGALACQGPTERLLLQGKSLLADPGGKIFLAASDAVLSIDPQLDIMYTEAGQYAHRDLTDDGAPALGSPIYLGGRDVLAISPTGELIFTEPHRVRKVNAETGLLETLTEGWMRWLKVTDDKKLIAVDQYYYSAFDFIEAYPPSVVEIDPETGEQTLLLSVEWLQLQLGDYCFTGDDISYCLLDFEVMADGSFLFLTSEYVIRMAAPDWEAEIFLQGEFSFSEGFWGEEASEMVLDESRGFIYFSHVVNWNGIDAAIARYNIETGELVRYAVGGDPWVSVEPEGNPLLASFNPKAMALEPDGNLLFITSNSIDESEYIVRIVAPENTRLTTGDIGSGSGIGEGVARKGDWMAVGVPRVAGDGGSTGQVLIYRDNDCRPILQERLQVPDGLTAREFGKTLAVAGDHLIVAGNEPQGQGQPFRLGAYRLAAGSDIALERDLSGHVASADKLDINTLATFGESFATGVPSAANGAGEVLVFNAANLAAQPVKLSPGGPGESEFGRSVALHEKYLAVGLRDNQGRGAVQLFERNGPVYQLKTSYPNQDGKADFGAALEIDNTSLYVGAPDADGGEVYRFDIQGNGNSTVPVSRIGGPGGGGGGGAGSSASFGLNLRFSFGSLIVSDPGAEVSVSSRQSKKAQTIQADAAATTGKVHVYRVADRNGPVYDENPVVSLSVSATEAFGAALDVDDGRLLVGAPATDNGRGEFVSVGEILDPSLLSGLWYDPALDGEGYNVLVTDAGLLVFYYGYDAQGRRLWLISDVVPTGFRYGENINVKIYKATTGEFDTPVASSDALVEYGLLSVAFGSNRSATFTLTGFDGAKLSRGEFLADTEASKAAYSGLWFNPALDGEGFNVISGQYGTVVYYYGSTREGERLWLLSELMTGAVSDGTVLRGTVYEMLGGSFLRPAPSSEALRNWGTIEARFDDCGNGRFVLDGADGNKPVDVIKLAGVGGAVCSN